MPGEAISRPGVPAPQRIRSRNGRTPAAASSALPCSARRDAAAARMGGLRHCPARWHLRTLGARACCDAAMTVRDERTPAAASSAIPFPDCRDAAAARMSGRRHCPARRRPRNLGSRTCPDAAMTVRDERAPAAASSALLCIAYRDAAAARMGGRRRCIARRRPRRLGSRACAVLAMTVRDDLIFPGRTQAGSCLRSSRPPPGAAEDRIGHSEAPGRPARPAGPPGPWHRHSHPRHCSRQSSPRRMTIVLRCTSGADPARLPGPNRVRVTA